MTFKSIEHSIKIPDELYFPKLRSDYREGMLQQVFNKYRAAVQAARAAMYRIGGPFDIRPSTFGKNPIVMHMGRQYTLPTVVIPCTVKRDEWALKAFRKQLDNLYLPEFG